MADAYAAEHLSAHPAARLGAVGEVIRPSETRRRLAWALSTFTRTRHPVPIRNIPL
jgi:hypothetical protein